MYILGTDEAGYGPNLGPLVVSIAVLKTDSITAGEEIYTAFSPRAIPVPHKRVKADSVSIPAIKYTKKQKNRNEYFFIDDSKKIYSAAKPMAGLAELEKSLLTVMASSARMHPIPDDFENLFFLLTNEIPSSTRFETPWEKPYLDRIPWKADRDVIVFLAKAFKEIQQQRNCIWEKVQSRVVFPGQFNRLCRTAGNKSNVLSLVTLGLVADVLKDLSESGQEPREILILCDKHGGRDKYGPLIVEQFADQMDSFLETYIESNNLSCYNFTYNGWNCRIEFRAKGDSHPVPALSSIACKYLRELFMYQFNQYWAEQVPDIQPTAGYPADAKRFREQTCSRLADLSIPLELFWRER